MPTSGWPLPPLPPLCSVEAVMREDRMLKAYEILELYLELLAVRR